MENKNTMQENLIDEDFVRVQIKTLQKGMGVRFPYSRVFLDLFEIILAQEFHSYQIKITILDGVMSIRPTTELKEKE